jgi:streptogramin lyase
VFRIPWPGARPYALVAAPGGGVVFLLDSERRIGEISATGRITLRPVAGDSPIRTLAATRAAAYFTDTNHDAIGRVGAGGAVSYLPVPTANTDPMGLGAATDGGVWFIEFNAGQLARIDPASDAIREYSLAATH